MGPPSSCQGVATKRAEQGELGWERDRLSSEAGEAAERGEEVFVDFISELGGTLTWGDKLSTRLLLFFMVGRA